MSEHRILMIEDTPIAARVLLGFCEQAGFQADHAINCQTALGYLEKIAYTLIFMDLGLSDGDGINLTRMIRRSLPKNERTPIIVVSAHVDATMRIECLQAGATEVLVKPLSGEIVRRILSQY